MNMFSLDNLRALMLLSCAVLCTSSACGRADSAIEANVRAQLAADAATSDLTPTIAVANGVVTLSGDTNTVEQETRAVEITRSVEGVVDVVSELDVADDVVATAVKAAFAADPLLASVPIEVEASDGSVFLRSAQTDADQRKRAVELARAVPGVTGVEDLMK